MKHVHECDFEAMQVYEPEIPYDNMQVYLFIT